MLANLSYVIYGMLFSFDGLKIDVYYFMRFRIALSRSYFYVL